MQVNGDVNVRVNDDPQSQVVLDGDLENLELRLSEDGVRGLLAVCFPVSVKMDVDLPFKAIGILFLQLVRHIADDKWKAPPSTPRP